MAYVVLARRYRSTTFDEVVGQNHIAQTLKRAIESNRLAHAFLFCGTRGTGKTTMARILAKALNCQKSEGPTTQPCLECESCKGIARGDDIDVIEIDAASNTQVDKTREVILDNAAYRPVRGHFKVYIIDEVHMLSKQSFNALLKTLEEPPEHVKFILATTEPEKVLQTILSRCQRYDFRNIPTREIAAHLKEICGKEGIAADDDAILLVAKAGAGSMRDSLSLLDRLLSIGEKTLTIEMIEQLLGLPRTQVVFELVEAIGEGRAGDVLAQASEMVQGGLSPDSLVASLTDHLRNLLIVRTCGAESNLVEVPGLSVKELAGQAGRFDVAGLTASIAILEELRRHMRQSQGGRALLDATLVRLSLAEQFTQIAELLGAADGSGGGPVQKKKLELTGGGAVAVAREVAPQAKAAGAPVVVEAELSVAAEIEDDFASPPAAPVVGREGSGLGLNPPAGAATVAAASGAAVVEEVSLELDGDDDLPRPGKVWEDSGPSLAELLKQQAATTRAKEAGGARAAGGGESSVLALDDGDLKKLWPQVLALLKGQPASMTMPMEQAQLTGIEDGQAVVKFPRLYESFARRMSLNGKRDIVQQAISTAIGKPTGVRFEIDEEEAEAPVVGTASVPVARAPAARPVTPARREEAAAPKVVIPETPAIRLTPELVAELQAVPLIGAIVGELGATIVKVSEEAG